MRDGVLPDLNGNTGPDNRRPPGAHISQQLHPARPARPQFPGPGSPGSIAQSCQRIVSAVHRSTLHTPKAPRPQFRKLAPHSTKADPREVSEPPRASSADYVTVSAAIQMVRVRFGRFAPLCPGPVAGSLGRPPGPRASSAIAWRLVKLRCCAAVDAKVTKSRPSVPTKESAAIAPATARPTAKVAHTASQDHRRARNPAQCRCGSGYLLAPGNPRSGWTRKRDRCIADFVQDQEHWNCSSGRRPADDGVKYQLALDRPDYLNCGNGHLASRFVVKSWHADYLGIDEPMTIRFADVFGKSRIITRADITVAVRFRPQFWPLHTEKEFRFVTRKDSDGVNRWTSAPLWRQCGEALNDNPLQEHQHCGGERQRMQAPYTAPKIDLAAFHCPHCGAFAKQRWSAVAYWVGTSYKARALKLARCEHCGAPTLWLNQSMIYPSKGGSAPLPNPRFTPRYSGRITEEVRAILDRSPTGCVSGGADPQLDGGTSFHLWHVPSGRRPGLTV